MRTLDIYTRVSHKSDKEILSTDGQERSCRKRLAKTGAQLGIVLTDPARSAWNPKVKRPDWETLMARLENGESDGVIVFDLARFARRPADGERLIAAAERGLAILDSGSEYDLTSSSGKKNFRDHMTGAAYYSDIVSDGTRSGKEAKVYRGEVDARRSFGFANNGVTVVEDEAAVIRDHATRLLAGETQAALVEELNKNGPAAIRGGTWGYTTYRQIMTRPRNAGFIVHNGVVVEGVRLPGEPILDEFIHHRLVALYAARKPGRPPSGRYVLTGIAQCSCGTALGGRPVYSKKNDAYHDSGRKQYWCKGCMKTFVDTAQLDDWAADWAIRELSDPKKANIREAEQRELEQARQALLTEQASIEATLNEIGGRLGRREITLPRHDAICKPMDERLGEITAGLAWLAENAESVPPPGSRRISASDQAYMGWLDHWDTGTSAERRAMVERALRGRKIVVGPGRPAAFDPSRVAVV